MVDAQPAEVPSVDLDNFLMDIPGISQTNSREGKQVAISEQRQQFFPRRGSNSQLILNRESERDLVNTQLTGDRSNPSAAANIHSTATRRLSISRKSLAFSDMRSNSVHRDNREKLNNAKSAEFLQNQAPPVKNAAVYTEDSNTSSSVSIPALAPGKDAETMHHGDPTNASLMRRSVPKDRYAFPRRMNDALTC